MAKNLEEKPPLSVVNLPSNAPKPPANLGPAGGNLWRSIMAEYDISDAGGQALLEQAALACDRAERLRAEIDAAGEIPSRAQRAAGAPRAQGRAGVTVFHLPDAATTGHQP